MAEVADGLHYAHGRGVIHRDIKPANLMLSKEGHLCVTDFGLARVLQEPGITVTGSFLGTPAYMSPEQIAAGRIKVDHRTDVYSLGVVLYEMLTMQRPFPGESREEILNGVLTKDPRPAPTLQRQDPRRSGDDLPQGAGEGPGPAVRDGRGIGERPEAVPAARTDRRTACRITSEDGEVDPAASGCGDVAVAVLIVVAASVVAWQAGGRGEAAQRLVADARLAMRDGTIATESAAHRSRRRARSRLHRGPAGPCPAADRELPLARWQADEARSVLQSDPQNYEAHAILAGLALYPTSQYRLVSIDPEPHLRVVEASAPESAEAYYLRALGTKRYETANRAAGPGARPESGLSARVVGQDDALGEPEGFRAGAVRGGPADRHSTEVRPGLAIKAVPTKGQQATSRTPTPRSNGPWRSTTSIPGTTSRGPGSCGTWESTTRRSRT